MSVRNGLLALLAEQPMHGYQLRQEFERRTGSTWPLNIGQVYTTLHRLVRDGLAEPVPAQGAGTGDDVERFRLTRAGAAEVAAWWAQPVQRGVPARDELAIKIALAVTAPMVDVTGVILSLIHISEPTRLGMISYAVFCLKKKKKKKKTKKKKKKQQNKKKKKKKKIKKKK